MTEAVHEYHPGEMEITEQVATFDAFGKMVKWGSLAIAALLLMLILWFCVPTGFFAALVAAVVLAAAGVFFLRESQTPHTRSRYWTGPESPANLPSA